MEKKTNMELNEVGTITATADKSTYARVKSADEIIVEEIREIMEESGISDFYDIDENKILQLVKEHKAIEIIKEKKVNCYLIIGSENLEDYNGCVDDITEKRLAQEEYDLLKEVLL